MVMKKIIIISIIFAFILPVFLMAEVHYLSEEDYKKLKRQEVKRYWENLETQLTNLQQRKADAIADNQRNTAEIEKLNNEITQVKERYEQTYAYIIESLGVTKSEYPSIKDKTKYFNQEIANTNNMSDSELWDSKKEIHQLINEYEDYRKSNYAKVPDFYTEFSDLDNKIMNLESSLEAAKPKYHQDTYTVLKGDWLSTISGYKFIYNDISKWPIIYRANRDQIKDPNLIYPDQVLKIPRGLPTSWKVYKGECLWRIAAYPEVYGSGLKWPLIYRANKDQIKDPDLIYPNQVFDIPRD